MHDTKFDFKIIPILFFLKLNILWKNGKACDKIENANYSLMFQT